jgi:hypothetical protein
MDTRGRDAPVEELNVINVARAPAQFRAFPDDTGVALKEAKAVACVGRVLKLLDGHVIAGSRPVRPVKSVLGLAPRSARGGCAVFGPAPLRRRPPPGRL